MVLTANNAILGPYSQHGSPVVFTTNKESHSPYCQVLQSYGQQDSPVVRSLRQTKQSCCPYMFQLAKDEAKGFSVMTSEQKSIYLLSTENYLLTREVAKYVQAAFVLRQSSLS